MSIEKVKEKKFEMERKNSAAMKEFDQAAQLQIESVSFSRCTKCKEFGMEENYNYNIETQIKL